MITRKLHIGIERYINAAQPVKPFKRIEQSLVIESNRLLFTGIASELPRFADNRAAQDLFSDQPHYDPNISFKAMKP